MKNRLLLALLFLALALPGLAAFAGIEQLSEAEFRALAKEIAPKVNLFRDVWAADPKAEFYGGTSRDYLYWLKGKFREARNKEEAEKIAEGLRKRKTIDVREFIIGESDVDIISQANIQIDPARYGVRKIDSHGASYFDPGTETWANELNQGHIPAEKIRLGANGTIPVPELGDGVKEIYQGKLSIHFADPKAFAQTKFAKEKLNHPILLALRYLRLQAMNYYQEQGAGLPDKKLLFNGMDEGSRAAVKKVIEESLRSRDLRPYLKNDKFKSWVNGTIQKSFLSYTNQTAALEILREFGVDKLPSAYTEVEPINQYVFQQYRDEDAIKASLKKYGVNEKKFYQPASNFFPDGQLYHGTKTEPAFRSILFQGALGSEQGSAGAGLYGVSEPFKHFSEGWGGSKDRLLRFPVEPDARIVDIKSGEGAKIFAKFNGDHEAFAKEFGVDILRYPYGETDAYVVKNSNALGRAQGVYRELLHFDDLVKRLRKSKSTDERIGLLKLNRLSLQDAGLIHDEFPHLSGEILDWLSHRPDPIPETAADQAALLNIAKKELYARLVKNEPAALDHAAKIIQPLTGDSLKVLLDAPDILMRKINQQLATSFQSAPRMSATRPYFYKNREEFEEIFRQPESVRLAPALDEYIRHGDLKHRLELAKLFAQPHMIGMENQMLGLLAKGEEGVHDALAQNIFLEPHARNFPRAFELWLNSSSASGQHNYFIKRLLTPPLLQEHEIFLKKIVETLIPRYPEQISYFLGSSNFPADKREEFLPLAMEKVRERWRLKFLENIFINPKEAFLRPESLTAWERQFLLEFWRSQPAEAQTHFTPLIMRLIKDLPPSERPDHYRRLFSGISHANEINTFYYFFNLPVEERPAELWNQIQPYLHKKDYSFLTKYANFTPGTQNREILDKMLKENIILSPDNLTGLALPRDEKALLKFLEDPFPLYSERIFSEIITKGALAQPEAAAAEETALSILRQARYPEKLELDKLLVMEHTKDWQRAQLLYLKRIYGWNPNANQLAAIDTAEGRAKIRAAILENKYDWQKKVYLNRHFPADGQKVSLLKGFVMDCAAGFARLK